MGTGHIAREVVYRRGMVQTFCTLWAHRALSVYSKCRPLPRLHGTVCQIVLGVGCISDPTPKSRIRG